MRPSTPLPLAFAVVVAGLLAIAAAHAHPPRVTANASTTYATR